MISLFGSNIHKGIFIYLQYGNRLSHSRKILVFFVSLLMIGSAITIITADGFNNNHQKQYSNNSSSTPKVILKNSSRLFSSQVSQMVNYSPEASFQFIETGLPVGTQWSVTMDNTTLKTDGTSLYFNLESGVYNYSVSNALNFFSPESAGTVNTSNAVQIVHYYGYLHTAGYVNISSGNVSQNPGSNLNSYVIPYGIFDNYSRSIIVASYGNDSIISLNASNYHVNGFLTIDGNPGGLALNPNGTIYATTSNQLLVISQNFHVRAEINISCSSVTAVAYNKFSGLIFVGTYSNGTYIFNSTTLRQVEHLNGLDVLSTQGFAIDNVNHMTLAADFLNDSIWFIKNYIPVSYSSSIGIPISILFGPNFNTLIISTFPVNGYSLFALDVHTGFVTKIGGVSWGMAITFDNETGSLFVSEIASNGIVSINYQHNSRLEILRTSYEPYFVIFDPLTNSIVTGGIYSNSLSLMNFSMIPVNVTFSEQGLPKGENWGIEINGYKVSTSNMSITLQVLPGMLNYTVIAPSDYTTNITGHAAVTSFNSSVIIHFHRLYTVNFLETGIPADTSWSVNINHEIYSSTGDKIEVNLTAGNYTYMINSSNSYLAALSQGIIHIFRNANFTVFFSKELHMVEFVSHNLPSGHIWSVNIEGRLFYANNSSIYLNVTEGQWNYSINPVPGYIPTPIKSTFSVSSNDTIVNISWSPVLFSIKISEIGLPRGITWGVSVGNYSAATNTSTIEFYEPNGTYTMHPFTTNGDYSADMIQFTVNGKSIEMNVAFSPVLYSVYFVRQNYSGVWYVNLSDGKSSGPIDGSSYFFSLLNGSYQFTISVTDKVYRASPSSGSFSVNGNSLSESINFLKVKYMVTFYESGLPADTPWFVNLTNGMNSGSITGDSYTFSLINGSYAYTISSFNKIYKPSESSGSLRVDGVSIPEIVSFIEVNYTVSFKETGLPAGVAWHIGLSNGMNSGIIFGNSYNFSLTNGSYTYNITSSNSEFRPIISSGSFRVSGIGEIITAGFMEVTFGLSVKISNLPYGTSWSLYVNGKITGEDIGTNNYSILLPNGTYSVEVLSSSRDYYPVYFTVKINGNNVSSTIHLCPVLYEVMINESGLPNNTFWQVAFSNGKVAYTDSSSIYFNLMNGTYNITYSTSNNIYRGSELTVKVNGANEMINATFTKVTYSVSFNISGQYIPRAWYLIISGNDTVGPNNGNITIYLSNGTYRFKAVPMNNSWYDYSGILHVEGSNVVVSVYFRPVLYDVNFAIISPLGLKKWNLEISGHNYTIQGSSFGIALQNGTYNYVISGIRGYETYISNVVVSGRNQTLKLVIPELQYYITFISNLNSGTHWNISVSNKYNYSSSNSSLVISLPDGKYNYFATSSGYDNVRGHFTVNGRSVKVNVNFKSSLHKVKFLENGLPKGTLWWVNVTGIANLSSSNHLIVFFLHNGYYNYTVSHVSGYSSIQSENFNVNNRNVVLHIHFIHTVTHVYSVSFMKFFPLGVSVNITVNDTAVSGSQIMLSNGTYNLSLDLTGTPFSNPIQIMLTVAGEPVQVFLIDTPIALWIVVMPDTTPLPPMPLAFPSNPFPPPMPGFITCSINIPQIPPMISPPGVAPPQPPPNDFLTFASYIIYSVN